MTAQPQAYHLLVDLWHRDIQAMVSHWQSWLSPRPSPRTKTLRDAAVTGHGGAVLYEFRPDYKGHRAVRETHYLREKIVRKGNSGPPLHIHLRQTETFEVEQGVLGVVKNGVEYAIRKEDGPVTIEPGTRHKFWSHATATEDLIFNVWVEPETKTLAGQHGFDEAFIRNFTSYLNDCSEGHKQKGTKTPRPSVFQLLLFLYDADMVLTPPFWLPLWFLVGLHHVLAYWVGAGVLGYKASYPEYSN